MSCTAGPATFRLLDGYVGWEAESWQGLAGLADPAGLRLAQRDCGAVHPGRVLAYLPPARLARGCGPGRWYLVTPGPNARLLRRDRCSRCWLSVWDAACPPASLSNAESVAAWRHRVAVADRGAGIVWVWARDGTTLVARIALPRPGPLAFTPRGELLVTGEEHLRRFSPAGERRGKLLAKLPPGEVDRLGVGRDGAIWLVTRAAQVLRLWRAEIGDSALKRVPVRALAEAFPPTGLTAATDTGFCLEECDPDGVPAAVCFSWKGEALAAGTVPPPAPPARQTKGQLLTRAIDSGVPRCHWHRVRVEAHVPPGTACEVAVATSEEPAPAAQGEQGREGTWSTFPAGRPYPTDWQSVPPGALDFLVEQPPGRYLFLRLRLSGDGQATPRVRRVRLDFPRATSAAYLPAVYLENPEAEDFTERFLGLFDAAVEDLDRAVERSPALLDPEGVPAEILPWLGRFLSLTFEPSWDAARRRALLRAAPELFRRRGTVRGLSDAVRLVFDVEPVIGELPLARRWGALGRRTQLGVVRLFGTARARFRVGRSPLGGAPLRGYGNPDLDPQLAEAYRFRVLLPAGSGSPLLDVNDLRDVAGLAARLRRRSDPVSKYLYDRLSPGTLRLLGGLDGTGQPLPALGRALTADLNELLRGRSFYDPRRFAGVALSAEVRRLLGKKPTGSLRVRLNRLLLEAAYPQVFVPLPRTVAGLVNRARVQELLDSQKPAHTVVSVRTGGTGFVVGLQSHVGIDTLFAPTPPPVLGRAGNVRLNRMSVLWPGPRGRPLPLVVGQTAAVGVHTVLE
jgi:phage tail-like protein